MNILPALAAAAFLLPAATLADPSTPPTRDQFEAPVKARMGQLLRDPESARYQPTSDLKYYDVDLGYGDRRRGWGGCYTINAKNGYGGYTGPQRYLFIVRDADSSVTYMDDNSFGTEAEIINRDCPALR